MREIMILGGGPAGLTAAVYVARKGLDAILIAKELGGQPTQTAGIENYMGYQYIEGPELMRKFEDQAGRFPIEQEIGQEAVALSQLPNGFRVNTDNKETYEAQAVIIATGKRARELNVPGEKRLKGRGVSYCAICDAPLFAGLKVAVIGGGNSALGAVDDLLKIADHVYLVTHELICDAALRNRVKDSPKLTTLTGHEVVEILGASQVEGIIIRDPTIRAEKKLDVGGVFVEIGLDPNSEFARDLVKLNEWGEIVINCMCETSVPGIFAAGDVTNVPDKQIVIAAGEGAKAALQAHRYLQRLPR